MDNIKTKNLLIDAEYENELKHIQKLERRIKEYKAIIEGIIINISSLTSVHKTFGKNVDLLFAPTSKKIFGENIKQSFLSMYFSTPGAVLPHHQSILQIFQALETKIQQLQKEIDNLAKKYHTLQNEIKKLDMGMKNGGIQIVDEEWQNGDIKTKNKININSEQLVRIETEFNEKGNECSELMNKMFKKEKIIMSSITEQYVKMLKELFGSAINNNIKNLNKNQAEDSISPFEQSLNIGESPHLGIMKNFHEEIPAVENNTAENYFPAESPKNDSRELLNTKAKESKEESPEEKEKEERKEIIVENINSGNCLDIKDLQTSKKRRKKTGGKFRFYQKSARDIAKNWEQSDNVILEEIGKEDSDLESDNPLVDSINYSD